ncbi:MAG: heme exporter protein CcmB [Actinobacteria bacterium]|nr:heme exporter protein CcmB [Actinomycetota bacterium]
MTSAELGFIAKTAALARKDLRIEMRARETLPPMLAFAFAVTVVLSFTLPGAPELHAPRELPPVGTVALADVVAGFLWITVLFAGLIGFARTFEAERDDDAIESLLLAPIDRSGLWLAKAIANLVFIVAIELFLVPAFALLFGFRVLDDIGTLVGVVLLVDLGFVATGTLFSALAAQTRSRELMLPILALPALVPVFLGAVELSSDLFVGRGLAGDGSAGWLAILGVYDVAAIAVSVMAFEYALD